MRPRLPSHPFGLSPRQPRGPEVTLDFEGAPVLAHAGQPVAVALWAAGVRALGRSPRYHRPRGPFCFAGHCGGCGLRIGGLPNRPACMTPAEVGLRCEREATFPGGGYDLLRAADWLFPRGLDHHHAMTGTRVGNRLFVQLARQFAGAAELPDAGAAPVEGGEGDAQDARVRCRACVVGGGPAGLAAAATLARALGDEVAPPSGQEAARIGVLLVDEQATLGGSLWAEPDGAAHARRLTDEARAAGVVPWSAATAVGYYPDAPPTAASTAAPRPGVLAVVHRGRLLQVHAEVFVTATGSTDRNLLFPGNDRPGVLAARGCGRLAFQHGVVPARRVHLVEAADAPCPGGYPQRLEDGLRARGVKVVRWTVPADPDEAVRGAPSGPLPSRGVLAVAACPAPAFELARQQGAEVRFDEHAGGFRVVAAADGATGRPGLFAAGDATGYVGPTAAEAAGRVAGAAAARALATPAERTG